VTLFSFRPKPISARSFSGNLRPPGRRNLVIEFGGFFLASETFLDHTEIPLPPSLSCIIESESALVPENPKNAAKSPPSPLSLFHG